MRYNQPQNGPLHIDWANPITRGLRFALLNLQGGPQGYLASGITVARSAYNGPKYCSKGVGYNTGGNTGFLYDLGNTGITGANYSFLTVGSSDASVIQNMIDDDASPRCFQFRINTNQLQFISFDTSGNPYFVANAGVADSVRSAGLVMGVSIAGAAMTAYQNGVRAFNTTGGVVRTPTGNFRIGGYKGDPGLQTWGTGALVFNAGWNRALSDAEMQSLQSNPWQLFKSQTRVFAGTAGGTDTPVNPAVGALALTGYSPTIAQSVNQSFTPAAGSLTLTGYAPSVAQSSATAVNPGAGSLVLTGYAPTITQPQSVAPGAGSLSITGFAPSVTQGITTTIAPGAGSLAFTGYEPAVAQSANQYAAPLAGTLAITGYAPTLTQTANQTVPPAVGALAITGYAPTVAQAAASPSLTPGAGVLSITGYAPSVVQAAPATKIGGDDVPREDEERIEIWEPRKPQAKRDDSLDKVVREAYAKATGKPIAAAVANPGPSVRAPDPAPFDYDEDDFEVLLLSY